MLTPAPPAILVVEDDVDLREALGDYLADTGVDVVFARDGADARRLLATRWRPVLLLVDLTLPRMGGIDLVATLRLDPELAAIPVTFITGSPEAAPAGASVLAKPFDLAKLRALILRAGALPA